MQTPAFFPDALLYCAKASSDEELFSLLTEKPTDLILFFEVAADDETWTENHAGLMEKLLEWVTAQVKGDRLAREYYQRVLASYQKHFAVLKKLIHNDTTITLSDGSLPANTFLLSASSDIFKDLIQKEIVEGGKNEIAFPEITRESFEPAMMFINTGTLPDLRTAGQEELYKIIRQASAWQLDELAEMAEESLKKFLTPQNCLEMLKMAIAERWFHFGKRCVEYINQKEWDILLSLPEIDALSFEFLAFSETALEKFDSLRDEVSELACSGDLTEDPRFGAALKSCRNMKTVNLKGSRAFTDILKEIPPHLDTLNVTQCVWLNKDSLKALHKICPNLDKLILSFNIQLNYLCWSEVAKFVKLRALDLSYCRQLQDEDLKIMLRSLRDLRDLSLGKCEKINENGFLEMAKLGSRLAFIDLSKTNVSDTAIVEIGSRCPLLAEVNLAYCPGITEKGILSLAKLARNLRKIDLTRCNISENALQEVSRIKPNLSIAL